MIEVNVGRYRRRPVTAPEGSIPPVVWIAGLFGLWALGPLVGWLRRPRIASA